MNIAITDFDRCPACRKKCRTMLEELGNVLIRTKTGEVICIKCGSVFVPKSWITDIVKQAKSPIIQPGNVVQ